MKQKLKPLRSLHWKSGGVLWLARRCLILCRYFPVFWLRRKSSRSRKRKERRSSRRNQKRTIRQERMLLPLMSSLRLSLRRRRLSKLNALKRQTSWWSFSLRLVRRNARLLQVSLNSTVWMRLLVAQLWLLPILSRLRSVGLNRRECFLPPSLVKSSSS